MKIEVTDDKSLLLFLDKDDMERLHLDIKTMLYSDESTREILRSLFNEAKAQANFQPQSTGNAVIEVLPFDDGSCIISFSFPKKRTKIKIIPRLKKQNYIYEFPSLESYNSFINTAVILGMAENKEVYEYDGAYRAVIEIGDERTKNLIEEYSYPVLSLLGESETREYWNKVS